MSDPTSCSEPFDSGWGLDEASPEFLADLARKLGVEGDGAKRRARLEQILADPAWLRERVRTHSAFELVLLETLVDMGGMSSVEALWREATRRAGIERELHDCEIWNATADLGAALGSPGEPPDLVAVVEPCLLPLRRMLRGLSMPRVTGPLPAEAERSARRLRDVIVAAARTAHCRVKATKDGSPNRSNRRAFEAEVAASDDSPWDSLQRAVACGLVVPDPSGRLVPDVARLRVVARDGFVHARDRVLEARLRSLLAAAPEGVIPLEALVRLEDRHRRAAHGAGRRGARFSMLAPWHVVNPEHVAAEAGRVLGLHVGVVDGVTVVGVPRPTGERDGHVLPNFDVMVGPNASLSAICTIAMAAELCRLDRMATFRLGPETVRACVAAGIECAEILAALEAVSRTGVPENVARCIEEWSAGIVLGRVVRKRVVVVPEAVESKLLAHRYGRALERLAPGVLAVAASLGETQLHELLGASGIAQRPDIAESTEDWTEVVSDPLPSSGPADEELRARVAAAMAARDFPELRHAHDAPEDASILDEIRRWHGKLPFKARSKVSLPALLQHVDLVATLALVDPQERARILRRSKKPDELLRRARRAVAAGLVADDLPDPSELAPLPIDFPAMDPRTVREALQRCADEGIRAHLLLRRGRTTEVTPPLHVDAIEPRGRDVVVLAHAAEGDDGLAFAYPLPAIGSVLAEDDDPSIPDDGLLSLAHLTRLLGLGRR